jgi:hypothetical protein
MQAMADMGLKHVRDVIVGDPLNKGISGGERKRLCVAMELITEPKLLFLDEPTSGLDSVTALGLIMTLKGLAWGSGGKQYNAAGGEQYNAAGGEQYSAAGGEQDSTAGGEQDSTAGGEQDSTGGSGGGGCTIICTIHQPQSKIFYQFDQ